MVSWRLLIPLLCLTLLSCNQAEECTSDSDCAHGEQCINSSSGWVVSSFCGPFGDAATADDINDVAHELEEDRGCDYPCMGIPGEATCLKDNTTVCLLKCTDLLEDCDGDLQNGCEKDLANDQEHCGQCNQSCTAILSQHHTQGACISGRCTPLACLEGAFDFDGDLSNGCPLLVEFDALQDLTPQASARVGRVVRGYQGTLMERLASDSMRPIYWIPDDPNTPHSQLDLAMSDGADALDLSLVPDRPDLAVVSVGEEGFLLSIENDTLQHLYTFTSAGPFRGAITSALIDLEGDGELVYINDNMLTRWRLHWAVDAPEGSCNPLLSGDGYLCPAPAHLSPSNPEALRLLTFPAGTFAVLAKSDELSEFRLDTQTTQSSPVSDPMLFAKNLEPWCDANGDPKGVSLVAQSGAVEFWEYLFIGADLTQRSRFDDRKASDGLPEILDFEPLGSGRFVASTPEGLYLFSANPDEHQVLPIPLDLDGEWGHLDYLDGKLSFALDAHLYLLPIQNDAL